MKIGQYGETSYHLHGGKIGSTGEYHIRLSSQQSDSENPEELRKLTEMTLNRKELLELIDGLQYIHDRGIEFKQMQ